MAYETLYEAEREKRIELERENVVLRAELASTLDYLVAWRADASKCQNQHLPIARLQKLLGITER